MKLLERHPSQKISKSNTLNCEIFM